MSFEAEDSFDLRSNNPFTVELALVVSVLLGVYVWRHIITQSMVDLIDHYLSLSGLVVDGIVSGGVFLTGLSLIGIVYATRRDIEIGLTRPSRADIPWIALTILVPLSLVAATKLVGVITGVPYNSLTKSAYSADAPVAPFLFLLGLGVVVGVPTLLVICQIVVQGSFKRAVGGDNAVVLTTLVTGFVMMSNSGGLTTVPDRGKLFGAIIFVPMLGVALYATERVDRRWLRYLVYVPVLLFVSLVIFSGVAAIGSIAGGLFAATQLGVLGLAAYSYERTDSILVPAIAYLTILVANEAVVFIFEAGLQSW